MTTTKTHLALALATALHLLCGPLASAALMPIHWKYDGARPEAFSTEIAQGDTRELVCTLTNQGRPLALPADATATFYYQTNGMDTAWFTPVTGAVSTNGIVTIPWTPALDCGARAYTFAVDIRVGGQSLYAPYGVIRMRKSPGAIPNEIDLPPRILDFATVEILNAPWPTAADIDDAIADALAGGIGPGVIEEVDPIAVPLIEAHAAATNNPHATTAEQVGALPVTVDVGAYYLPEGAVLKATNDLGCAEFVGAQVKVTSAGGAMGMLYANKEGAGQVYLTSGWWPDDRYVEVDAAGIRGGGGGEFFTASWPDTLSNSPVVKRDELEAAVDGIFSQEKALLIVESGVARIETNAVPIWTSSGGAEIAALQQQIAALQQQVAALQQQIAGVSRAWGDYAPDGSANPDPDYMVYLNKPATVWASGFQWATSGGHAVLTSEGAVAFAAGDGGELRIGPGDGLNYFGFVMGGSYEIGADASTFTVDTTEQTASIRYPYAGGDFPTLHFTASLAVPFEPMAGVVWVDNADGTATVTAPATTDAGFWRATTTATYDARFETTMPALLMGGIFGDPNAAPVQYDSVITIQSGGTSYRIPAEAVK